MSEDILVVGTMKETETKPENIIICGEKGREKEETIFMSPKTTVVTVSQGYVFRIDLH